MKDTNIQWHPGFIGAMNLEFKKNRDDLLFEKEHNLNTRPLEIDLLVIKKQPGVQIENEIGRIFRGHNVIEYKTPEDELNIDAFYKASAYACLYKSYGNTVDSIKADDVTMSLVRKAKPYGLFHYFREHGYQIMNSYRGIYYVEGNVLFPTQIVVTKELDWAEHIWLGALSDKLKKQNLRELLKEAEGLLREKEKQIEADLFDQIVPQGGDLTVLDLVHRYISLKTGIRHNTEANYNFVIHILEKESSGKKRIDKIKLSNAKEFLIKLQKDGRGYSTVKTVRGVLRPAFRMAADDDLIRKNPFDFQMATVVVNDSVTREAITIRQERDFLNFVKQDKHFSRYYDGIFILFHTGMRISEFVGLTVSDVGLKNRKVNIDHQLQRTRGMQYVIEDTKTTSGTRQIPMTEEVYECFRRILANREAPKVEPMIDGYTGFLYLDKNQMPMVALHWEHYFKHICQKYNRIYKVQMPKVTPHVCRHTFCSNMAKSGMNPKTLQYLMGHSDIGVTLNTYTHIGYEDAEEELKRMSGGRMPDKRTSQFLVSRP